MNAIDEAVLPQDGLADAEIDARLDALRSGDMDDNRAFAYVVHPDDATIAVAKRAYLKFFSTNALAGDKVLPSLARIQADLIRFCADLTRGGPQATGVVTPAGTESIFMAVKAARDWARTVRPVKGRPAIVMPWSGYPSVDKAAAYLGMDVIRVPIRGDFGCDAAALRAAITPDTVMMVAGAPNFSHGVFDPAVEMEAICRERNLWLHVDACIGGFLAPFFKKLGEPIPDYDFSLAGVTSISMDFHKYGYGPKSSSAVLFRNADWQRFAEVEFDAWPGGRYPMPAFTGTRAGAPIAAAWAAMKHLGVAGYLRNAQAVLAARRALTEGIAAFPELRLVNAPELSVINFGAKDPKRLDIFAVADGLVRRGYLIARLKTPPALHIMTVPRHEAASPGFLRALGDAVAEQRRR